MNKDQIDSADIAVIIDVLRGLVVHHTRTSLGVGTITPEHDVRFQSAIAAFVSRWGMHGVLPGGDPVQPLKILGAMLSPDITGGALIAKTQAGKVRITAHHEQAESQFSSSWWPKEGMGPVLLTEACDSLDGCIELTDTVLRNILSVGEDLGFEKLTFLDRQMRNEAEASCTATNCSVDHAPMLDDMIQRAKGNDEQPIYSIIALTVDSRAHRWEFRRRVDLEDRWQTMIAINAFRAGDETMMKADANPHRTIPMSYTWDELVKIFRGGDIIRRPT